MKRKSSLILLSVSLLLGCARTKTVTQGPVTSLPPFATAKQCESYALSWLKPISINGLTVILEKVEDSRCPKDVLCIWAGNAVAQVQLTDTTGTTVSQTLSLGDMVKVELGVKTYQVTLRDVTPYPKISDLNQLEKEAKVSITPL